MPLRLFFALAGFAWTAFAAAAEQTPASHYRLREHPSLYAGPGRELPLADVAEVRLGYFGPSDPADRAAGDLWLATSLAIDEANARGGFGGKPFVLAPAWSATPWAAGVAQLTRKVYVDRVWAILGGIDGSSTHLAEQVVAKARLPLVSPNCSDKSANLANVPWMFSLLPGDHLQAAALAPAIAAELEGRAFVLLSTDEHDAHLFARELLAALAACGVVPRHEYQVARAQRDVAAEAARAVEAAPAAVAIIADAADTAALVASLRQRGYQGAIFGSATMGRSRFLADAGPSGTGVVFPLLFDPAAPAGEEFARAFTRRAGHAPDYAAAHAYDAARLLIAALEQAGLNRAKLADALRALSPWTGVTGRIEWDPLGSNTRPPLLGTIHDGRVVPLPAMRAE